MAAAQIILASRSPRRAELLRQIGVDFEQIDVEIDETPLADEAPQAYVLRLARQKVVAACRAQGQQLEL
ncbi:septum formation protein Maf, partial [Candidatus Endoriftia persephone str. Guaymas]|nr:septum formation protein Maf [Candidatus Endoriftia persephone str. Guaymas]